MDGRKRERDLIELEHGDGDPEDGRVDGRLGPQQRKDARQAHDDGVDERRVGEALERLDEDAQQLLDVAVRDHLADAAVDDQRPRLQRRVVTEREALGQRRPNLLVFNENISK